MRVLIPLLVFTFALLLYPVVGGIVRNAIDLEQVNAAFICVHLSISTLHIYDDCQLMRVMEHMLSTPVSRAAQLLRFDMIFTNGQLPVLRRRQMPSGIFLACHRRPAAVTEAPEQLNHCSANLCCSPAPPVAQLACVAETNFLCVFFAAAEGAVVSSSHSDAVQCFHHQAAAGSTAAGIQKGSRPPLQQQCHQDTHFEAARGPDKHVIDS